MLRSISFALALFFISFSAIAAKHFQEFNPNLYEKIDGKYAMKNQLIVALPSSADSANYLQQFNNTAKHMGLKISSSEMISSNSATIKIIKLKLQNPQSLNSLRKSVQKIPNIKWVQPNYIYNIGTDPREIRDNTPDDPRIKDQYYHQLMDNLKAWDISTGKDVVVAVTDDGFDLSHEDLSSQFIAGGGYNFCDNNSNVTTSGEHGTHVSGIIGAELNNGKGGAGVAGHVKILPVKFYGWPCNWTSETVYKAYKFAVDNGAKIISTSYNVDNFLGDNIFIAGLDYAYNKGVLHFNSAGNNNEKNPQRQAFEQLILVASTNEEDIKSYFSNYGSRVQISAPGEHILSTIPGNQYEKMSGTSMATPNAAGSAALIWSAHPTWNRDQVAAQLIGTADNIDNKNPYYKGLLGSGRINNYRALTEHVAPAKITEINIISPYRAGDNNYILAIHFDKLLDPNVVNKGNHWEIKSLKDSAVISATMEHPWLIGSTTLKLVLPELTPGKYQLTIKDSLQDPFAQAIDGDANGTPGGNYVDIFEVK